MSAIALRSIDLAGRINTLGSTSGLISGGTYNFLGGTITGTLTVDGDYTQHPEGALVFELASTTSYDQLAITGNAIFTAHSAYL